MAKIKRIALIIGAMKSGTTSLFEYLGEHPDILKPSMKEPEFFAKEQRWHRGVEWYTDLWETPRDPNSVALEASTSYTRASLFDRVPSRIASCSPPFSFQFIYLLRDPIQRIESHYNHGVRDGWFDEPGQDSTRLPYSDNLIDPSRYACQLDEYVRFFERDDILLLNHTDLAQEPGRVLRRVCKFLCLDPDFEFSCENRKFNQGKPRKQKYLWWIRFKKSALGSFMLEYLAMRYVPRNMRHAARRLVERSDSRDLYSVDERLLDRLASELRPELKRLRDDYGFDVSQWPSAREIGVS